MATNSKPAAQPWYPFGSGPPKPAMSVEEKASADAAKVAADAEKASKKKEEAEQERKKPPMSPDAFKAEMKNVDAAVSKGASLSDFATNAFSSPAQKAAVESRLASAAAKNGQPVETAKAATAPPVAAKVVPPAEVAKSEKPEAVVAKSEKAVEPKAERATVTAKSEKSRAAPKAEHHPQAAVPRSPFGEVLHAEAKEHVRANSIITAAMAQGLSVDAIKALADHRLQGHAKELAQAMTAGAKDNIDLSLKLSESQQVASALQAASAKASTPEQAQAIVDARLKGDPATTATGVVTALADIEKSKLAALQAPAQEVIQVATASAEKSVALEASGAKVLAGAPQEVTVTPLASATPTAATLPEPLKTVTATAENSIVPASLPETAQVAPSGATVLAVAPQEVTVTPLASAAPTAATLPEPFKMVTATAANSVVPASLPESAQFPQEGRPATGSMHPDVALSVKEIIQSAASAGASVSLESALTAHMQDKGFDDKSIASATLIAEAIRSSQLTRESGDTVLVLHKTGLEGDPLASIVSAKDVLSVAQPGDSLLALDTLEKIAHNGLDAKAVQQLRESMPGAAAGQSDLEVAQSAGEAKSAIKGMDGLGAKPEQPAKEAPEQIAQAEMADSGGGMSM
jgi:hypothetical protein